MLGHLPSRHAPLRVAGRGRGWGVYRLAPLAASLLRHPPPPTPPPPLGEGGAKVAVATASCLKSESGGTDDLPTRLGSHGLAQLVGIVARDWRRSQLHPFDGSGKFQERPLAAFQDAAQKDQ